MDQHQRPFSLAVERWLHRREVVGSNPTFGLLFFSIITECPKKKLSDIDLMLDFAEQITYPIELAIAVLVMWQSIVGYAWVCFELGCGIGN